MATLVLSSLGTVLGGPLGGAIGGLIGNSIDRAVLGGKPRTGPRLKELTATTSSYGTPIPRHFGRMRTAGSVIWATELQETSQRSGGGKGQASTTTYSYSVSFAVALSSRPLQSLGRIWADGRLLRGSAGDLKAPGSLRFYTGHGDQTPDPLIAADKGASCPAFRGLAYCVFEDLHLGDFGNRIPMLSFEVVADTEGLSLATLLEPLSGTLQAQRALPGVEGISDEGGPISALLEGINPLFPISCDTANKALSLRSGDTIPATVPLLPAAASADSDDSFAKATGSLQSRKADSAAIPSELRYYDEGRDYQPGLQRTDGQATGGRSLTIDLAASLSATTARTLINQAARRSRSARDRLSWRMAALDPAIGPGSMVSVPGHKGVWFVESWEWRESGIECELQRIAQHTGRIHTGLSGDALTAPDLASGPTQLAAFELPWDGSGSSDERKLAVALSSPSKGWTGAALFAEHPGGLTPIGAANKRRDTLGTLLSPLPPAQSVRFDAAATLEVQLLAADQALQSVTMEALANGQNQALAGDEILQFLNATPLGVGRWRLSGLLRGRGGTEAAALCGQAPGERFVLLDQALRLIDPVKLGTATALAALGLADNAPVSSVIINQGLTLTPLNPVHPRADRDAAGGLVLHWHRRARGAWRWNDQVTTPLIEPEERYRVGLGDCDAPDQMWDTQEPHLTLTPSLYAQLQADYPGAKLWVRQIGKYAVSAPTLLTTLP